MSFLQSFYLKVGGGQLESFRYFDHHWHTFQNPYCSYFILYLSYWVMDVHTGTLLSTKEGESSKGFFTPVIPTHISTQSYNPDGYFQHPTFRANLQSQISPPFCFKIPYPESRKTYQGPTRKCDWLAFWELSNPSKCVHNSKVNARSHVPFVL